MGAKYVSNKAHVSQNNSCSSCAILLHETELLQNISFEEKFRRFPIDGGEEYVPKFVLNDVSYGTRHVVVDMYETPPTKDNTAKLRSFIDRYGTQYCVVLVVHDGYLRE